MGLKDNFLREKVIVVNVTQKKFVKDLFEKNKKEVDEIKEIVRIIELLKSEKEENEIYTTSFHSA